ncbi:MAG: hypothetical protein IPK97_05960 [Ahniella sp.]|nr:hypothetical protein [Ahniella sp.]
MRPVESSLPAVTHNAASTALTRESRRVAAAAKSRRFVLLTLGLACWVAGAAAAAEPIDLDTGFGGNGVLYAPVDAPNSTSRDRTVAVYQDGSAAYVVVAETANASGGYSPTFIRLTSAGVQSRNTVNLSMIGINAACQDPATGGFVVGMRTTSMNGNAITFRKYDAAGIQDMTFRGERQWQLHLWRRGV